MQCGAKLYLTGQAYGGGLKVTDARHEEYYRLVWKQLSRYENVMLAFLLQ